MFDSLLNLFGNVTRTCLSFTAETIYRNGTIIKSYVNHFCTTFIPVNISQNELNICTAYVEEGIEYLNSANISQFSQERIPAFSYYSGPILATGFVLFSATALAAKYLGEGHSASSQQPEDQTSIPRMTITGP